MVHADPCTGGTKDEALARIDPKATTEIIDVSEAEVRIIQSYLKTEKHVKGPVNDDVKSAIHYKLNTGMTAVITFDKDGQSCGGTIIPPYLFEEFKKVLEKSKV